MNLEDARRILTDRNADDLDATLAAHAVVSSSEPLIGDLLSCLNRKGLPAEIGAMGLYRLTKRPLDKPLIVTYEAWRDILATKNITGPL